MVVPILCSTPSSSDLLGLGVPVVSLTTQVEAMFCTYIALSTRDFFFFFLRKERERKTVTIQSC